MLLDSQLVCLQPDGILTVILLQSNESWFKRARSPITLKMLGPLCNHTVNLETDTKIRYYSLLKREITWTGYSTKKIFNSTDRSLRPTGRLPWIILHLWGSYASGMQDTEVKKSLTLSLVGRKVKLLVYRYCCTSCVALQLFLREKMVKDFTCYWYMKTA